MPKINLKNTFINLISLSFHNYLTEWVQQELIALFYRQRFSSEIMCTSLALTFHYLDVIISFCYQACDDYQLESDLIMKPFYLKSLGFKELSIVYWLFSICSPLHSALYIFLLMSPPPLCPERPTPVTSHLFRRIWPVKGTRNPKRYNRER